MLAYALRDIWLKEVPSLFSADPHRESWRHSICCLCTYTPTSFKQKGSHVIHHWQTRSPPCHSWRSPLCWGSLRWVGGKDSRTPTIEERSGGLWEKSNWTMISQYTSHVLVSKIYKIGCFTLPATPTHRHTHSVQMLILYSNTLPSLYPSAGRHSSRPGFPSSCSVESSAHSS